MLHRRRKCLRFRRVFNSICTRVCVRRNLGCCTRNNSVTLRRIFNKSAIIIIIAGAGKYVSIECVRDALIIFCFRASVFSESEIFLCAQLQSFISPLAEHTQATCSTAIRRAKPMQADTLAQFLFFSFVAGCMKWNTLKTTDNARKLCVRRKRLYSERMTAEWLAGWERNAASAEGEKKVLRTTGPLYSGAARNENDSSEKYFLFAADDSFYFISFYLHMKNISENAAKHPANHSATIPVSLVGLNERERNGEECAKHGK